MNPLTQLHPRIQGSVARLRHAFSQGGRAATAKWMPIGLLDEQRRGWDERYSSIPPEALPILTLGVDGCHLALWVDDPTADVEPCVVYVSPMDSNKSETTLGSVFVVCRDVEALIGANFDPSLDERSLEQLDHWRREQCRFQTFDGLGVPPIAGDGASGRHPAKQELRLFLEDGEATRARVDGLLDAGHKALALAITRDLLALGGADHEWFLELFASVYARLERPLLAQVGRTAYARYPAIARESRQLFRRFLKE